MVKYDFQTKANDNIIIKQINKKVNRYFSEIMKLKELKELNYEKQHFLIILGGKNNGKSFWAIEQMLEVLKNGGRACYMRNTLNEVKAIKVKLAEMIKNYLSIDIKVSDENITTYDKSKILVNFIQAANYNKLSGNLEGYDILIYDEFNQIINETASNRINNDFFNIINTAFRNKDVRVIACGNTKTKNNIFFNKFKINPINTNANITTIKVKNEPILFINYLQTAFKKINGNEKDYNLFQKYDELNYKIMFEGTDYDKDDDTIINNFDAIKDQFISCNYFIINDNRLYQLNKYINNNSVWFLDKTNIKIVVLLRYRKEKRKKKN